MDDFAMTIQQHCLGATVGVPDLLKCGERKGTEKKSRPNNECCDEQREEDQMNEQTGISPDWRSLRQTVEFPHFRGPSPQLAPLAPTRERGLGVRGIFYTRFEEPSDEAP
jgi:hypothetical protein